MSRWLAGWRLALRLARRDLLKHKARAIIALVMVTLPVLAVVAADILIQTTDVSAREGIERRLGAVATAQVEIADPTGKVVQNADPLDGDSSVSGSRSDATTVADIEAVIGHRSMVPAPMSSEMLVRTPHGREPVTVEVSELAARLTTGLYRLDTGRWPRALDEVVVNQALLDRGVDHTLTVVGRDGRESTRRIVGTVVHATYRSEEVVVGLPGSLPDSAADTSAQRWLVDGPPITWAQVQQLNALGVFVTDRHIASHPDDYPQPVDWSTGVDDAAVQTAALIIVMALIEVVLLAGPAFAVGARKQQRALALLVSSGGTPAQARRVILAGGLLLGVTASVLGVLGGLAAGWLLQPAVQRFNVEWLGPFDVPWLHVLAVAVFGLASAFIASLVPAWIASRQNVVAVLAGRRGDAKPVRAFPVLGLVLFAVGVLMAIQGARDRGDLFVAWSAVVCVLGMVLLVPVVVSWVARVAGRFPLPVRFAARDAVRHRTRTTPAVAAVAATVAGVVALGISTASDEKQNRETYQASLAMGDAAVTADYAFRDAASPVTDWDRVAAVVREHAPGAEVRRVSGVLQDLPTSWIDVAFLDPATPTDEGQIFPAVSGSAIGTDIVVSDGDGLPRVVAAGLPSGSAVPAALEAGRAVVFTGNPEQAGLDQVAIRVQATDDDGNLSAPRIVTVPATVVLRSEDQPVPVRALLPAAIARAAGLRPTTVGLDVRQPHLSTAAEKDLAAALEDLDTPATVYVERGYHAQADTVILQWVLAALGAVLMLGGTLTASFLAISDARPDLATLQAVGAAPRVRRAVAAAYTFVVAFVGAVLGLVVGFVPGLAITWPLTAGYEDHGPYVDVPWPMIALVVVGLPVLTALVVGLFTRSRLPMVTRLS